MQRSLLALTMFVGMSLCQATFAEQRTITFSVEKMTCALCPITVRMAMQRVKGVKSVQVDLDSKTARVVFDSSVTTPEQIAEASANAGYPAYQNM